MKKQPFLIIDFHSTVDVPAKDMKQLRKWLDMASEVCEKLVRKHLLIPPTKTSKIRYLRVSLLLCGEQRIRKLNLNHRGKNKVTDVLSFPAYESLRKSTSDAMVTGHELFIGDLVICHQQTLKQARTFEVSYHEEFIHLFFHGFLHLMGYDHEISLKEEKVMQLWEDKALSLFSAKKKGSLRSP